MSKTIEKLIHERDYGTALTLIRKEEEIALEFSNDLLAFKMLCLQCLGKYEECLDELTSVLPKSKAINHWNRAAELAIQLDKISGALSFLDQAIELSISQSNEYYIECCYLERAYVNQKLGRINQSMNDLSHVSENLSIFWLGKNIGKLTNRECSQH